MPPFEPLGGCPYPTVREGDGTVPGTVLLQPELCVKCQHRACAGSPIPVEEDAIAVRTCSRGVDYVTLRIREAELRIIGLFVTDSGQDKPRRLKAELADQRVTTAQIASWRLNQLKALAERDADVDEKIRESLEMFHDVQTAASTITRSAERLQASQPGRDDDEKFGNLPAAAQTLVKAAGLLGLRIKTMPIVTNPAAAEYGSRIRKPIYRVIHLLVRTLQPVAEKKNVEIRLLGSSRNMISVFESFDLLPLTLIENAIKYSAQNTKVDVTVKDTDSGGVSVSITSFSPWIHPDERQRLFERRYRSAATKRSHPHGSGLGLYIAETVAVAHATHVYHGTDEANEIVDGCRYCSNTFSFSLRQR